MKIINLLFKGLFVLLALALLPRGSVAQSALPFKDRYAKYEYLIPMRDGTHLYTAVYVPKNRPDKHPILLERTPYGAGPYGLELYRGHRGSPRFEANGYIFAFQDVRGLGHSEGTFVNDRPELINALKPHDVDESTDTYDTIEYLVHHVPDNNGRVGLWGISYPGFYAGAGAIHSHPALKAASPQAPVSDWFIGDDFHHNGALFLMDAVGFARFGQSQGRPGGDRAVDTDGDPMTFYRDHGALGELTAAYFSETDGIWKDLMAHGTYDEYWQARSLPLHMRNVRCAIMVVGGWFDAEDCWGALHTYQGTKINNRGIPTSLVMGPWFHGMWAGPKGEQFGDFNFGQPTSTYFQEQIEFPFFDTYLRGDGRRRSGAQVFDTGAYQWRTFPQWPPRETRPTTFYLLSDHGIGPMAPKEPVASAYDQYVSDPGDPVPYQGGKILRRTREYMIDDQRFATSRQDVLTYRTPPLTQELTLAGPVEADLAVSTTGTDADFIVKLIDVFPDNAPGKLAGYQMLVRAEVMRAKFRDSYSNPAPMTPDKIERVRYALPDVFHTLRPGHQLMIQVQSSWFPLVDRNPQRFMNIYQAKSGDFQKATIHLYRAGTAASSIRVGVLPSQ